MEAQSFNVSEHSDFKQRRSWMSQEYIQCNAGLGLIMCAFSLFLFFLGSTD